MSSSSLPTSTTTDTDSTPQPTQLDLDDDWTLVSQDWWKLSFHDVSWHHRNKLQWSQDGLFLQHHPKPLQYHAHLFNDKESSIAQAFRLSLPIQGQATSGTRDLELSPALIGVKVVEDVINRYELDVGIIHPQIPPATTSSQAEASLRPSVLFDGQITPSDLLQIRNYWESLAASFLGISSPRPPLSSHLFSAPLGVNSVKLWDLNALEDPLSFSSAIVADATRSPTKAKFRKGAPAGTRPVHPTSSRNSRSPDGALLDLTDSELSADSDPQPPTPYSEKKSYAAALVYDDHGHVHPNRRPLHKGRNVVVAPSPSKPLNAAALSFIPAATTAPTSQLDDSNPQHHLLNSPLLSSTTGTTTNDSTSPYTPTYEFHFPSLTSQPIITSSPTRTRKPSSGHRHNQSVTSTSKTGGIQGRKRDEERDRSSSLSGLDENDRLGARSLPPNLRKDDQGFYTEVSHSSSAMPASLVSRPLSSSANLGLGAPPSGDSGATSGSSVTGSGSAAAKSASTTRTITPKRPPSTSSVLPAFLGVSESGNGGGNRARCTSRTREMVEKLRLCSGSGSNGGSGSGGHEMSENAGRGKRRKVDVGSLRLPLGVEEKVDGSSSRVAESGEDGEKEKGLEEKLLAIDGWITSLENQAIAASSSSSDNTNSQADDAFDVWGSRNSKKTKKHKRSVSSTSGTSAGGAGGFVPTTPSSTSTKSSSASSSVGSGSTFPSPASSMTSFSGATTTGTPSGAAQPCSPPSNPPVPLLFHPVAAQPPVHPVFQGQSSNQHYHPAFVPPQSAYPGVIPPPSQAHVQAQVQAQAQAQAYMQMQAHAQAQAQLQQWQMQRMTMGMNMPMNMSMPVPGMPIGVGVGVPGMSSMPVTQVAPQRHPSQGFTMYPTIGVPAGVNVTGYMGQGQQHPGFSIAGKVGVGSGIRHV